MMMYRKRPPYVEQVRANSCWAAALEMWQRVEQGYGYSQDQLLNSAGDFTVGPSGINLTGLQQIINDVSDLSTTRMYTAVAESADQVPQVAKIIQEVGHVYIAYSRPDGRGGHVNVLFGYAGSSYSAVDPDPGIRQATRSHGYYFTRFPALVGWRETPASPGLDYTGRAPWDYL